MKTKRILTEQDAKFFFETSINTLEDSIGTATVNRNKGLIEFDFNAVLLLSFPGIFADASYALNDNRLDSNFVQLVDTHTNNPSINEEFNIERTVDGELVHFNVKVDQVSEHVSTLIFICYEKLFDTETQIGLFSKVVGSGLSLFQGSTWWIDYDKQGDYFYQSDTGPEILGIPVSKDKKYKTSDFQVVREKAQIVSEFYDQAIEFEKESYERVRRNETDFFAGRTPTVTINDDIVWVEAYGKCILRYPDGRPRFFLAIDIYMSEIYQEKTQLELLNNLTNYGLTNSDVGVWYHQRHYLEGKYYFTPSFQELMSTTREYKNETFTDIFDEQIQLMIEDGNGYEEYLHEFRRTHNSIYTEGLDKYHLVIPNFKNKDTLMWIEVRGNVIERDDEGHVMLFVGVNVDVTESTLRNRELERLRIQNERLQLAENLAIKARSLMVWYQEIELGKPNNTIFGNELFEELLGLPRTDEGMIHFRDIRNSVLEDDPQSKKYAKALSNAFKDIYRAKRSSFERRLAKHKNPKTGDIMYIEHSVEISEYNEDGSARVLGGVLLDVTNTIQYQQQIRYLADYDTLTNVFNRNYFEQYIEEKLPNSYSILLFDLDGLKLINDVFGHMEGDRIIVQLAKMLKKCFPDNLFISRIGGDEFAVLSPSTDTVYVTDQVNDLEAMIEEFNHDSEIEMNVSKGAKDVIQNNIPFDKAFVQAENIMYRRKLNNRTSRKSKVLDSIVETLNQKTEETKEHSDRMSELAVQTMRQLNMIRASEVEDMELLARVHDIGKITVDDKILKKPGPLTEGEFEIIKRHSEAGYKIIRNITDSDNVCNGVLLHHERWDGTGYPQGLKGDKIPIFARIISVVDAYDAMTNDRIYHNKLSHEDAIKEIKRCEGTQFDPTVVQAFLKLFP